MEIGSFRAGAFMPNRGASDMEMKNVLMASSAAIALVAGGSAQADDYFTVFGGASFQADVDVATSFFRSGTQQTQIIGVASLYTIAAGSFTGSLEHDAGFVLGAAYGRNFSRQWRGELEMAYRENNVDGTEKFVGGAYSVVYGGALTAVKYGTFTNAIAPAGSGAVYQINAIGSATVPVEGSTSFFSIMANVWYDFNIVDNWELFIGGGLGMAQANANNIRASIPFSPTSRTVVRLDYALTATIIGSSTIFFPTRTNTSTFQLGYGTATQIPVYADGSDWVFAYQFGVGAGYTLDNGVRLSAQYRYFGTDTAEIDNVHLEGESSEFLFGISFPLGN